MVHNRKFGFGEITPDAEEYPAFEYLGSCSAYHTCIWQAAVGEEFVLTDKSFGIWEGCLNDYLGIH